MSYRPPRPLVTPSKLPNFHYLRPLILLKGGRLLIGMVEGNHLKRINAEDCCKGKWTREEGGVKSITDYVITRNDDGQWLNEMEIDEGNEITPYSFE